MRIKPMQPTSFRFGETSRANMRVLLVHRLLDIHVRDQRDFNGLMETEKITWITWMYSTRSIESSRKKAPHGSRGAPALTASRIDATSAVYQATVVDADSR
jgi:hypothetical protein